MVESRYSISIMRKQAPELEADSAKAMVNHLCKTPIFFFAKIV